MPPLLLAILPLQLTLYLGYLGTTPQSHEVMRFPTQQVVDYALSRNEGFTAWAKDRLKARPGDIELWNYIAEAERRKEAWQMLDYARRYEQGWDECYLYNLKKMLAPSDWMSGRMPDWLPAWMPTD